MEGEGKEDVGTTEAVEGGGEFEFGEGEGVAKVKVTVHVREGEVAEEFLARLRVYLARFGSEDLFLFPPFLNFHLDLAQTVPAREALRAIARHFRQATEAASTENNEFQIENQNGEMEKMEVKTAFRDECNLCAAEVCKQRTE